MGLIFQGQGHIFCPEIAIIEFLIRPKNLSSRKKKLGSVRPYITETMITEMSRWLF